jgi:hypothetical protein
MSTSYSSDQLLKPDRSTPATPFDVGSGRLDVAASARAGFVLKESGADFLSANPSTGGFPENLNVPSLVNGDCRSTCVFTRTLTSVSTFRVDWQVTADLPAGISASIEPSFFTLGPGNEIDIVITIEEQSIDPETWLFGDLRFEAIRFEPVITYLVNLPLVMKTGHSVSSITESEGGGVINPISPAHFPVALLFQAPQIEVSTSLLRADIVADFQTSSDFEIRNLGGSFLDWTLSESAGTSAPQAAFWEENFDAYNPNQSIHGVNGWKGWLNDETKTAYTSLTQDRSPSNSLKLEGVSDVVQEFSSIDSGMWLFQAWQYIPGSSTTGEPIFLILNQYDDVISPTITNFSTSVLFDLANMEVRETINPEGVLPLLVDQWVEIRVIIDLDQDVQRFYYDGVLLFTDIWSDGLLGGGISAIAAVEFYANESDPVYWDDLSMIQFPTCSPASDIPWLSLSKYSGSLPGDGKENITASFDSTGLGSGSYQGSICISSNAVIDPLLRIPVLLDVE